MVDKEEVTLIVYDIWEQVRTKMWPSVSRGRAVWLGLLTLPPSWLQHELEHDLALSYLQEQRPTLVCLSWLMAVIATVFWDL